MKPDIIIYTDGSAHNNPQLPSETKGGYGIVMINGTVKQYCGGSYANTTSARMELLGAIRALSKVERGKRVELWCDNQYVVNCIEKAWIQRWKLENWRQRKNKDLLKLLLEQYNRLERKVEFKWCRGHDGNHYNEMADKLATQGAQKTTTIWDMKED